LKKTFLTVVLPNTIESVPISASSDDSIKEVFVILTNNWFIDGEKYYSASIKNQGRDIKIDDFSKKLSEFGVDTAAFLFVTQGTENDYKTPVAPPKPSAATSPSDTPPQQTRRESRSTSRRITPDKNKITFLNKGQAPEQCLACEKKEWLQERLDKDQKEINMHKYAKEKSEEENAERQRKINDLSEKIDKKQAAEWIALFGSTLIAIGGIIDNAINPSFAFDFTIVGAAFVAISLIVSHVKIDFKNIVKRNKKGTKDNGQ